MDALKPNAPAPKDMVSDADIRLMVDALGDYALFLLDTEGHVRTWNAGAHRFKGYQAHEIIGKHIRQFYPQTLRDQKWPEHELEVARETGRFEDEGWRVRKDGSKFWASVVITPLVDERGTHRGFAKVTRDLTEERRMHTLEDEGRRTTAFLAMLGHELRNPLAPIANALAIMERAAPDSEHTHAARAVIGRQLLQLTRLVDDLLDVGRVTSGKILMARKVIRIADVIGEAVEAAASMAEASGHSLTVGKCDGSLRASADKARLLQVVSNLLNNAIKFTPRGGWITVALRRDDNYARISVKDSGVGIPDHMLAEIFRPFVQGQQDAARSQGGLGLGLCLAQQIIDLHGGHISVFSATTGPSLGSEFVACLPLVETELANEQSPTAPVASGRRKLLIVDDNRDAADTLKVLLESLGYDCQVVYDGMEALDAAGLRQPDAVLLDLGLPGLDGLQVADRMRTQFPGGLRLIALTGYGSHYDRENSSAAGFDAHLTKPANVDELANVLGRLLA